ncbi:MAG: hypothetical protein EHM93_04740 [Bacteroidales bacterium]|nr:MAG: hypothetical protein EHM93_04740 [Bacteroidales bacterium]
MIQLIKRSLVLVCFSGLLFNQFIFADDNKYSNTVTVGSSSRIPYFDISQATFTNDTTSHGTIDVDQMADSLTQKVQSENKIVDLLDPEKIYTLPIGIGKNIGGLYYIIVLDDLKFTPQGLTAKAYMSVTFPGSSKKFGLVADNVKIGVGGIQAAQLKMLKDKRIDLPGSNNLLIKADSTYVDWDCNGYKGTQLSAEIYLDEKVFFKENPVTRSIITGEQVKGNVLCSVVDFNDILLSISLDPFQVKGVKDFSFYPKEIVLDLSDNRNAESMQFPSGFQSALFDGSNENLWRGLYINSFTLKFPKKFTKSGPPPEVTASKFLIDFEGITGKITLNYPLITLDQGSLGDWKFSVNSLSLELIKNDIAGFGMTGGIVLPITEPNKPLSYKASIDADKNFLFQVTLPGDLNVPLFGGASSIKINSNSIVSVSSRDGDFYPKAVLHGTMKIGAGGSSGASLADIKFQGLTIQREEPQLDIESLSMQAGNMSGFPVQVTEIKVQKDKAKKALGLEFTAMASLMSGKIEGATSFVVWATRADGDWKYKSLELRMISVDANTGPISFKGKLANYKEDPVYGNGFFGYVDMSVTPGIAVSATAQFGNIAGDRYWYADASLSVASGITVFPGFAIYGFGGGAYYHMQRNAPANILMETKTDTSTTPKPGKTDSGITYTPNKNIFLGLNASVIIGTQPSPKAFNGKVTFGMEFNSSFGLNKLYFLGDGKFMDDVNSNGANAKVKARVSIEYLFAQSELSGFAEAYINVANVIKGSGSNNLAGRVEFYFAKSKWHIYVGTPTCPIGVKLMNVLTATSYFMVGTELPDFPALPAKVASLSSKINFTNMRSTNLTKSGGGFAFGASLVASTGEKSFLIFYGKFELGAGFDFMLKNFGTDARCEGRSGPLGINGWYAQGQAWAYVDAAIGVKVRVFRRTRKFSIVDAGFAAALGAQLPNPTYFAGAVEARFSVLGGLVKGKCHFEFSYGDQCKLVNASAVEGIKVISEVTPAEGGKDIDVFITPQVAFNMPIGEAFKVLDTDGKEKAFRVALDYFKILDNEQEIPVNTNWNSNRDVLALKPVEVLPGQKGLKASIKVHFQYQEGGVWKDYAVNGEVEGEESVVIFRTGDAPDYITQGNVKYTYPVKNMVNFYKNEYGKSYIELNQGVNYLFAKPGSWTYLARFSSSGNTLNMPVTYNSTTKRVELDVPASLTNSAIYQMRILRVPSGQSNLVVDKNVTATETNLSEDQSITTKDIEGTLSEEGLTELYSLHFRTSKFNTFVEKMNNFSQRKASYFVGQGIALLYNFLEQSELFGKMEMENIVLEAYLDNNEWYNNSYKNLIYTNYPIRSDVTIDWRESQVAGIPPIRSCRLVQSNTPIELTQDNITTGSLNFDNTVVPRIEYYLSYYVIQDWANLRSQSFKYAGIAAFDRLINFNLDGFDMGKTYYLKLMYYTPGQITPTSTYNTSVYY